jgi:hypothetical protein
MEKRPSKNMALSKAFGKQSNELQNATPSVKAGLTLFNQGNRTERISKIAFLFN